MIVRYSLIFGLTLFTCLLVFTYFEKGMGNAFFMQADYSLKEWRKEGKVENKQEYLQALESINKALEYDANNPHYYNSKATILDWGVTSGFEHPEINSEIEALYHSSIMLRAHWPITWVELAATHSYSNGVDEKTLQYIDNAFKYGPFDKDVIRISLNILLSNWDSLEPSIKNRFYQTLALASKNVTLFSKVLNHAKQNNKEGLVCLQIKYNTLYKKYKDSRLDKQFCS